MECPDYSLSDFNVACKLKIFIYDLKPEPRVWFEKFHSTICLVGFRQSSNDYSLIIIIYYCCIFFYLLIYVLLDLSDINIDLYINR